MAVAFARRIGRELFIEKEGDILAGMWNGTILSLVLWLGIIYTAF